jgi:hypothetical protein
MIHGAISVFAPRKTTLPVRMAAKTEGLTLVLIGFRLSPVGNVGATAGFVPKPRGFSSRRNGEQSGKMMARRAA